MGSSRVYKKNVKTKISGILLWRLWFFDEVATLLSF